ncbi:MAG TPA: hypothetical protein VHP11_15305, partial [Tepidisphaeraceae bacterium]|nr:hypothetical protein [Tepidisphaeraceae bacterium]
AKLSLVAGSNAVLKLGALSIGANATLDLADNDLIVSATAETRAAVLAAVASSIKSARGSDGKWAGAGLSSSAAKANKYTGLACMLNADKEGKAIKSSFAGQPVTANDILVKYTWNGDVTLDGKVDLADYFLVDAGFITQATGYRNGDLTLDGKVDLADYFLIDSAFISQNASLSAQESPVAVAEDEAEVVTMKAVVAVAKDESPSILQQLFSAKPVL